MTKKKISFKSILIGLILLLTFVMLSLNPIYAAGLPTGNSDGDASEDVNDNANDWGPTYGRAGWLVTLCDDTGKPALGSKVVFFPYANNNTFVLGLANGSMTTEFFDDPCNQVCWSTPINNIQCWSGSSAGGPVLKAWLMSACDDTTYASNAHMVIKQYLGIPIEEIDKVIAEGTNLYVQFSTVYWCKIQNGPLKSSQQDIVYIGNCYNWAEKNGFPTYIDVITHNTAPESTALEFSWWGLGFCTNFKGAGEYWSLGEFRPNGLGIGGVSLSAGHQVTITIEDSNGSCQTQYLSTGAEYNVLPKIGNAVLQSDSGFVSKEFTKANSPSATYGQVKSGCTQIGGLVGAGNFKFIDREGAKALFLHYKGELPPTTKSDTDLYAWELLYRLPGEKAGSTTDKRTNMDIEHHSFNEMQQLVEAWQEEQLAGTSDLLEKVELDRSLEDDHDYTLSQDHGQFNIGGGIWQLYRGQYEDKWVTFPELAGKVWDAVDDKIDPNYAYYLGRSHLEGLGIVPARGAFGKAELYLSTPEAFTVGYEGKQGKNQQANTIQTWTSVAPYNYNYIPHWSGTGAFIEYKYRTRSIDPHGDSCYGDNPTTTTVVETDYLKCTTTHYTPWSDWTTTTPTAAASQFYTLSGNYGDHNIDKYKVQVTGTGISGQAGSASPSTSGVDLNGKFVKGSDFDYRGRISKAVHGSQFPETYKLYGEVPMCLWVQSDTYTYGPMTAEVAFIWSEYQRSLKPSLVHGFKTEIDTGIMNGIGSLATAATGHTAQTVRAQSGATTLGITAMGTTFNVATTSRYKFDFRTIGLTTEDEKSEGINANSAWGNEHSPVQAAHNMYVDSVLAGVQQELIMELTFKPSGKKLYYTMLTDTEGVVSKNTVKEEWDLWWKNNGFADNGTDYSGFYDSGVAESYLNLNGVFNGALINNGDNGNYDQHNDSKSSDTGLNVVNGTVGSYGEYTAYENWYDEECWYRFETEKYSTTVLMDFMGASDKVDYNLLTQSVLSNYLNQKDFVECRFYTRLWRDSDTKYTDGYYSWDSNPTFRVDKVNGIDFTVINQSTEDMKK